MIDNNPIFSKKNITRLCGYISDKAYILAYKANGSQKQKDAAKELSLIKYLIAHIADHFFGFVPACYFLSKDEQHEFQDFIDDLRHDPKHVLETLVGFVDNAFNEVDYIKYPEDELYRKIKRDIDTEEDVLNFLIEIHKNFDEFRNRLLSAPQNQDASKPSETTLKTLINTISKIQDYMLTQGEAHNQTIYAMRYSKMLDLFKYPLLFAWEQFK